MEFIKYIGTAHRRVITADDFRRAGFANQGTVEWSYANNFSVPLNDFSDDVLRRVIHGDPMLVVMGGEAHEPRYLGQRMTPAQAAGARIDIAGAMVREEASESNSGPVA